MLVSAHGLAEPLVDDIPIDDRPEGAEIVGTGVAVVDIVGVFPHIGRQERAKAAQNGVGSVWLLRDGEDVGIGD